jgi:hypothetical protein
LRLSRTESGGVRLQEIAAARLRSCLNEFYRVAFPQKIYRSTDLDAWIAEYNEARRWCFGKTPMQTFLDAMPMTREKMIAA